MASATLRCMLAALFASLSGPALAEDEVRALQLAWDNDVWGRGSTDRWYTNGLRASWSWQQPPDVGVVRRMVKALRPLVGGQGSEAPVVSYGIGQTIYTPRDIRVATPQPFDRPWGAMLYGSLTVHGEGRDDYASLELKLGTTGRAALGRPAQAGVHRYITKSDEPMGWHGQLKARPVLQASYAQVWRWGQWDARDWFSFQVGMGGAVGTVRTHANVNAALLLGDLSGGANPPLLIANEGDFIGIDTHRRPLNARLHGFLAVAYTGVAYNYFLEGETPYGRSRITPRRSHRSLQAGLSLPLQSVFGACAPRLVLTHTVRSPEFDSRLLGRDEGTQRWGAFAMTWDDDDQRCPWPWR